MIYVKERNITLFEKEKVRRDNLTNHNAVVSYLMLVFNSFHEVETLNTSSIESQYFRRYCHIAICGKKLKVVIHFH